MYGVSSLRDCRSFLGGFFFLKECLYDVLDKGGIHVLTHVHTNLISYMYMYTCMVMPISWLYMYVFDPSLTLVLNVPLHSYPTHFHILAIVKPVDLSRYMLYIWYMYIVCVCVCVCEHHLQLHTAPPPPSSVPFSPSSIIHYVYATVHINTHLLTSTDTGH